MKWKESKNVYKEIKRISDNFDTLDYNNFEPLFGPEFSFDPSQFIDFAQLSEIEDISSKESKREADQITDTSYPGFSHSYDFIGHTNSESSLGSDMDSYRNVWREGNGEIKTNDDKVRHLSIRGEIFASNMRKTNKQHLVI
ncbi:Uncharacterized protein BM_BM17660 [Brugia malayi]|uniref:Uncharacterized protein n=1 Tax=Brugia malayi TaxID=6279 RepID=A0A4E9FKM1_BRUMA|nr:Uncharacterized protein BM_BM17660 [Brugia malayi]VIO96964.1 Uncharacterized protein BM_BM17660 [Brugia malayi]